MKRLIFIFMIIAFGAHAQAPQAFKFQAVIRTGGDLVVNKQISVRVAILKESVDGDEVYSEVHSSTTTSSGVVNLEIGNGDDPDGDFGDINWANGIYFVKIEMDPDGGSSFLLVGTSQLLSVPYSLYAKKAHTADMASGPWLLNGLDASLSYGAGKVSIGTASQESPSGLFVNVPTPTSAETKSNGIFVQASDVLSRGFPLWLRSNTTNLNFGESLGDTQGRLFRMQDQRHGFDATWDLGIGQDQSMFIMGGNNNYTKKFSITTTGNVGINQPSPNYTLDVNGTINASNILVNGEAIIQGGETDSFWQKDFDENLSYTAGRINIGTTYADSPSGLYINVPVPTTYENRSNGLFIQANDVISRGLPLWIRSNTSSQTFGTGENETLGRMFRMQDQRFDFEAIWDFGIGSDKSMYIMGGDLQKKLSITTGGDVYINNIDKGVIMKSPNGSCFRMTVSDAGTPVFTAVSCPN